MTRGPVDLEDLSELPTQSLASLLADRIDWIPKRKYIELFGETVDVINKRCRPGGGWQRGIHFNKPDGGGLWISIKAVNAWASGRAQESGEATSLRVGEDAGA